VDSVTALTFDIFGTVFDWRTTIIREGARLEREKGIRADWPRFADAWRGGYEPGMHRVRTGELPWTTVDRLHRMILDDLLVRFGIEGLTEAEKDHLNRIWHRLIPWPDAIEGIERLRRKYLVAALSNGNVALLTHMAKHAGVTWDCILSAELARHYKPDPEVYLTAAELLDLAPSRIMMAAAHLHDLRGAQAVGFRTAFIPRPLEYGPDGPADRNPDPAFDIVASDIVDLADQLGA
jgi:2-haloacid dehalogenase